ncbi:hypothetical protein V6N12_011495 [Hibiscus sabdariffa]|uniref:DUF4283 domain-containing protein n=1 Tax=Hibiscus sabdariffa TaxID=183260 RepID=A0ABR2B2U6_9ROSI
MFDLDYSSRSSIIIPTQNLHLNNGSVLYPIIIYFNPVSRWPFNIILYFNEDGIDYSKLKVRSLSDNHSSEAHGHSLAGEVKFALIGKLLSPRLATETVVVRTFTNIWAEEKVEILPLKHGVFLFKFPGEQQCLSVLRPSPWLFDGEPIITLPFDHSLLLNEYDFSKILY